MAQRLIWRLSWPLTCFGALLFLLSFTALAQNAHPSPDTVSFRDLFLAILGIAVTVVGAWVSGFKKDTRTAIAETVALIRERDAAQTEARRELAVQHSARAARIEADLENTSDELAEIHRLVLTNYHSKAEITALFTELKSSLTSIHRRLDRLHVPSSHDRAEDGE